MHNHTRKKGQKKWATMLKASSAAKAEVKKISSTSKAACTPLNYYHYYYVVNNYITLHFIVVT